VERCRVSGRARQTTWDGSLKLSGGRIISATPINFLNPDRQLKQISDTELRWLSITTGNMAGIDLILSHDEATLEIETPMGSVKKSSRRSIIGPQSPKERTSSLRGNANAPTLMMGERAARFILGEGIAA
jgi:hypothetical protein